MPGMLPPVASAMPQPWRSETPDEIYSRAVESERHDNHADAADLYQEAAIRGHLSAMVALGRHLIGLDDRTSVGWFRAAAERGHPTAWTELGHMYARGYGVERSNPHAVACWQRGAMLGDNPAKSCLGLSYIQGFGVPKDAEKGIGIVRQIAESGDVISMRNLAWVYRTGRGVPKNPQEAEYWDERAASAAPVSNKPILHPTPPNETAVAPEQMQAAPPADDEEAEGFEDAQGISQRDLSPAREEEEEAAARDVSPTRNDVLQEAPHDQAAEDMEMLDALDEAEEPHFLDAQELRSAAFPKEKAPVTETEAAMTTEAKVQGANIPPKTSSDPRSQVRSLKLVDVGADTGAYPGRTGQASSGAVDAEVDVSPKITGDTSLHSPTVTYLKLVPVNSNQERTYIATETTEGVFEESANPVIAVVKSPTDVPSDKRHPTEPVTGVSSQAEPDLETLIQMREQAEGRAERATPSLEVEGVPRMRVSTPEQASPQRSLPYVTTQRRGSFWGSPEGGQPGTASGLEVVDSALTKLKSGSSSSLGLSSFSSIPHTKVREVFPNNGDGESPSALEGPGFAFQHVEEYPIESHEKKTTELGSYSRREMERKLSRESIPLEVHPAALKDQDVERKSIPRVPSKSSSSSGSGEDVVSKRPSALEAARKAILHHSKPVKKPSVEKSSNTIEKKQSIDNAKRNVPYLDNDMHQDAEVDNDAVEVPLREPVSSVVEEFEKRELQSKGPLPPPPPPPPPRRELPGTAPAREGVEPAPPPPVIARSKESSAPSVFKRPSGFMTEIESSTANFPSAPELSDSREAVYYFVDVAQRLRADDVAEGAFLTQRRAWDLVVAAMFSHPRDVCIQERALHALIRLLRFLPEDLKEDAVLRSSQECFAGLPHERLQIPVELAPQESGPLQGIIYAMRNFPSTRLVQMAGCAALADLAEVSVESRVASVNLGAVTQIALALEQKDGNVMSTVFEMACRAVSAICSGPDMVDLKQSMAEQRIVEAIIFGLERWTATAIRDDEYLLFATRSACAALRHVCTGCKEACLHALNSNVFRSLTHALKVYMADTATCTVAIAAIIAIATVLGDQAEPSLDENDVLPTVLASMKTHPDDSLLVRKSLMCLESLAVCKSLQKHAVELGTVEATVAAADNHKNDPRVQEQACSTLERLSNYCTAGKDAVAASNGMRVIALAVSQHPDDIGVVERAALAASSTCTNHSVNQNSALQMGLAGNVVRALGVHGRQSDKLVIACSTAITALAQAKDPAMGRKMAREEAPEELISALQCHIASAEVVEHTAYAIATLCVADGELPGRLTRLNVEKAILKAFKLHITSSRCVLAILSAIRVSVAKPNQLRLRFMTDMSTGTGLAQLIHQALVHHMNPFPESNMVVLICGTLNFLAFECVPHKKEIGSTGIIEKLIEMIQIASRDANVVGLQPSLATVCTLVLNSPDNQDRFQTLNGVELTLDLMKKWHKNPKVLEHCCIALRYSCNQHSGNCEDMKRLHGVKALVSVMKSHLDDPRLFEMACLALAVLCQGDKEIQESPNVSEAIKATCEAMEAFPEDPVVQVAACTLFLSATFENEANKKRVVRYGGRTGIVKALEGHPGHLELAETASYALLHVESVEVPGMHRPDVKKASDEIENSGQRRGEELPKAPSRNRISFSRSRSRRMSKDGAGPSGASGADREAEPIAEPVPEVEQQEENITDESSKLSRRSRRYSRAGRGSSAEGGAPPPAPPKKSGPLSFLKFGRSRSKKNMRPAVAADDDGEAAGAGSHELSGEHSPVGEQRMQAAVHHGYSEEGDVYPRDVARQAHDAMGEGPMEDVFDPMHPAFNDGRSTGTGSGHEFYSVD